MGGGMKSVFAATAVAMALLTPGRPAGGMTLPAPLAAVRVDAIVHVKTVCEKEWDGYEWQSRCRNARPKNSRSAQIRRLQRRIMYYLRHW